MSILRYEHFLGGGVTAFSSDGSLDFLKGDPSSPGRFKVTGTQELLLDTMGIKSVIFPKQVHGNDIWEVTAGDISQRAVHEADAVVTAEPGLAVAVRTADCLPLLMCAPIGTNVAGLTGSGTQPPFRSAHHMVVAAVHAGWKSTRLEIAARTVALLKKKYAVDPKEIRAAIGPCIRPASYPVGAEFKGFFPGEVLEREGCLYFDIAAANVRQLLGEGVVPQNIMDCGCDTYADRSWHSFRRDGEVSGRMIHAVMLKG